MEYTTTKLDKTIVAQPIHNRENYDRRCDTAETYSSLYYSDRSRHLSTVSQSVIDYSDFPIISYYRNKYGVHPSKIVYSKYFNCHDFEKKIKTLHFEYYCDSTQEVVRRYSSEINKKNETSIMKTFFSFELKGNGLVFLIILSFKKEDIYEYTIHCLYDPNKKSEEIFEICNSIFNLEEQEIIQDEKKYLQILTLDKTGYDLMANEISTPDIDFSINYNEDFGPIHELITEKLSVDKSKGLILLHGMPGTGKTTYVRHLIGNINKKIIYIPPNMVNSLSDPELVKFFIKHSNSILVIEDAENVLMKREAHSSQAIANILNLTDGLLSDCTNIQVVATFNASILNIDEALLRKGRLIAKYEFKELSKDRAEKLAEKLGATLDSNNTLANIYNSQDMSFQKSKTKIGF
jgi:hypothetical protein